MPGTVGTFRRDKELDEIPEMKEIKEKLKSHYAGFSLQDLPVELKNKIFNVIEAGDVSDEKKREMENSFFPPPKRLE